MAKKTQLPHNLIALVSIPSPIEFFVKFAYPPKEVLHIGAHLAEEKKLYAELGIQRTAWVEAQPEIFEQLQTIVGIENALNTGVWSKKTVLKFKVAGNSVSSSLFDLDRKHPWHGLNFVSEIEIQTVTMDDVIKTFNQRGSLREPFFVVLDIQGAEYEAILGWKKTYSKTVAISCEVSRKKGYSGAPKRWRIIKKLLQLGFVPCAAFLDPNTGHGDQLFLKSSSALRHPQIIIYSIIRTILLSLLKLRSKALSKFIKN